MLIKKLSRKFLIIVFIACQLNLGHVSAETDITSKKDSFQSVTLVSGPINSPKLYIYKNDLLFEDKEKVAYFRLLLNASELIKQKTSPQSIRAVVYKLNSINEKTILGSITRTLTSNKEALRPGLKLTLNNLVTTGDVYIDLYDSDDNLFATYKTLVEVDSSHTVAETPLNDASCNADNFGDCQIKYLLDNIKFEAAPKKSLSTLITKELDGKYKISIPVLTRVNSKSRASHLRPIIKDSDSGVIGGLSGESINFYKDDEIKANLGWNDDLANLEIKFANQTDAALAINSTGDISVSGIKLKPKTLSTTPADGTIEYDGTKFYFTAGGSRTEIITEAGAVGPQGPAGPQGVTGPQGPAGTFTPGSILTDVTMNGTTFFRDISTLQINGSILIPDGASAGYVLTSDASGNATWQTVSASTLGGLAASEYLQNGNNLSDLANAATARTNLGVAIGTDVQAYNGNLVTWSNKAVPSGTVIGSSDTQTLTNKTIQAALVNGTTFFKDNSTLKINGGILIPDSASAGYVLTSDASGNATWQAVSASTLGGLAASEYLQNGNNLSDLANAATARTNLGVAIGTDVQAYNGHLATFANSIPGLSQGDILFSKVAGSVTRLAKGADQTVLKVNGNTLAWETIGAGGGDAPTLDGLDSTEFLQNGNNLSDLANAATARTNLGVAIGTDVQAYNGNLATLAGKAAPSGTLVGTTDTQTLTNKTLTSATLNSAYLQGATFNGTTLFRTNSIAKFNGSVLIPASAGAGKVFTSDASGYGSWSALSSLSTGNASTLSNIAVGSFLRSDTSDDFTSGKIKFISGTTLQVNGTLNIPTSASAGYVLTSDASGNATWQAASGGGGSPAGSNGQLQYKNGSSFAGANLYFNGGRLSVGHDNPDTTLDTNGAITLRPNLGTIAASAPVIASSSDSSDANAITKPAGTADGDLLLLVVTDDSLITVNLPAGFTEIPTGNVNQKVAYKIASSEGATYNCTGGSRWRMTMLRITGADTSSPINVSAVDTNTTTSPSVTTTEDNALIILVGTQSDPAYTSTTALSSIPASTSSVTLAGGSGWIDYLKIGVASTTQTSAGATGTYTWGGTASDRLWTIAIAPAGSGTISYSAPSNPDTGASVLWTSGVSGSNGDLILKSNVGGTTKTFTLYDYSTNGISASSLGGLASADFLQNGNNLSDLANAATARTNLGLAIGSNVQAYNGHLATLANTIPGLSQGDILFAKTAGSLTKLAKGADQSVLKVNGNTLAWETVSAGGASVAGSNTEIQFNNSGSLGASNKLTWDGTSLTANGKLLVDRGTAGAPTMSFLDDPDTGIYGNDQEINLTIDGTAIAYFTSTSGGIHLRTFTAINDSNTITDSSLTIGGPQAIKESTAPGTDSGYGKLYVNSSNSKLYFIDDSGNSFNLQNGATTASTDATTVDGIDSSAFLRSDTTDNFTSGTLITNAGTRLDVNGDLSIADTNISLDGASTTFTQTTGAITVTPASGSNFNVSLAGAGDFAVNTNQLYVDTSTANVGISDITPSTKLDVNGGVMATNYLNRSIPTNTSGATIAIDWNTGSLQTVTLNQVGTTFNFTNPTVGYGRFTIFVKQDATGSRTISSWDTDIKWPGGSAPTLSTAANAIDIVTCIWDGTNYFCQIGLDFQ